MGDLLGVSADTVVFGRSMTALTFDLTRTLSTDWSPGDEVIVSRLDHDANIRPWVLAAQAVGATVRWAEFDRDTGELDPHAIEDLLTPRTRWVAVTAASNLIGTMPDVPAIAELVHSSGARLFVDGVHVAAHAYVDVPAMGADVFACSPYKFFGPHCGVLTGRADLFERLAPGKLLPSIDSVPERFELGTLPYELMAGTAAAVDFIADIAGDDGPRRERIARSWAMVQDHEHRLLAALEDGLRELPGATLHSRADRRTPTVLVTFEGHDSADVSAHLAERGVNAPAGSFYALEASRALGLGDTGGLRIGLAAYTSGNDIDRLLDGLRAHLSQPR